MTSFPQSSAARRSGLQGFTLIELMVVIGLLGIIAALAAPSFKDSIDRYRIRAAVDELNNSIQFARSEAIRTRQQVVILQSNGCALNNWGCGWTIFRDTNRNNAQDAGEVTVKSIGEFRGVSITNNSITPQFLTINIFGQSPNGFRTYNFGPNPSRTTAFCTGVAISGGTRLNKTTGSGQCPA